MSVALPLLDPLPIRPDFAQGPRHLDAVKLLRISITDRCNFRCIYCMPDEGIGFSPTADNLSQRDIVEVARAAMDVGVTHLKITGGEPTVRADLPQIISELASLGAQDLSMTTNGVLLNDLAKPLREAGLDRLTFSWDTMKADRFARIARGGARNGQAALDNLIQGIDASLEAGFERLKFNVVVIGGINDDEVVDFARLTLDKPFTVRFIEYMPLGDSTLIDASGNLEQIGSPFTVDSLVLRKRIEQEIGLLTSVNRQSEAGVGPAEVFSLPNARGRIGFISSMSKPFCESCNRLRLTATGELRSCLFDGGEVNMLETLRISDPKRRREQIIECMRQCVVMKPEVHGVRGNRAMSQLGG
jgi:cyclic pyranopterin phosphate synthase